MSFLILFEGEKLTHKVFEYIDIIVSVPRGVPFSFDTIRVLKNRKGGKDNENVRDIIAEFGDGENRSNPRKVKVYTREELMAMPHSDGPDAYHPGRPME